MEGQVTMFDLDSSFGKTYREPLPVMAERTFVACLNSFHGSQTKPLLFLDLRTGSGNPPDVLSGIIGASHGEPLTLNIGESPSEERESALSQILEDNAPQKYYLSARACQGILRRAEKGGKVLPPMLEQALRRQAGLSARTLDLNGGSPACNQGGMAVVQASGVVSKGNGDCFVTPEKHMSLSVGGGQAGQGYPCACIECNGSRPSHKGDGYAGSAEAGIEKTSRAISFQERAGKPGGGKGILIQDEHTGVLSTLNNQSVCYPINTTYQQTIGTAYDGSQVCPTLTANNANGAQRMPDKGNFNAVITYGVDCYNQTQAEEVSKSLSSSATDSDRVPCVYGLDRASFNQGQNAQYDFSVIEEQAQTLVSRGPGGC